MIYHGKNAIPVKPEVFHDTHTLRYIYVARDTFLVMYLYYLSP
jgi:hypothetical protein